MSLIGSQRRGSQISYPVVCGKSPVPPTPLVPRTLVHFTYILHENVFKLKAKVYVVTRSDLDGVSFLRVCVVEELKCYSVISLVSIIKGCPYTHTHGKQGHSGTWVRSDMCFEFLHLLVFLRKLLQSCIVVTISFLHFLFFKHLFDIRSWLLNLYQTSSMYHFFYVSIFLDLRS